MAKKKKRSILKRLAFWAIVGVLLWLGLAAYQGQIYWNRTDFSGRLESAVNEVLYAEGIRDAMAISIEHSEEIGSLPIPQKWVRSVREFRIPKNINIEKLAKDLKSTAARMGAKEFSLESHHTETVIYIGEKGRLHQVIRLSQS